MATNLVTLGPYRDPSPEGAVHHVEVVHCLWCRWRVPEDRYLHAGKGPGAPGWCVQPEQFHRQRQGNAMTGGICSDWNRRGDCTRFSPTLGTRILRAFGLRPRVFRSVDPPTHGSPST